MDDSSLFFASWVGRRNSIVVFGSFSQCNLKVKPLDKKICPSNFFLVEGQNLILDKKKGKKKTLSCVCFWNFILKETIKIKEDTSNYKTKGNLSVGFNPFLFFRNMVFHFCLFTFLGLFEKGKHGSVNFICWEDLLKVLEKVRNFDTNYFEGVKRERKSVEEWNNESFWTKEFKLFLLFLLGDFYCNRSLFLKSEDIWKELW